MTPSLEVHLSCGDTITTTAPTVGAYRRCIHCDARRRIVAIAEPAELQARQPCDRCAVCHRRDHVRGWSGHHYQACPGHVRDQAAAELQARYQAAADAIGDMLGRAFGMQ